MASANAHQPRIYVSFTIRVHIFCPRRSGVCVCDECVAEGLVVAVDCDRVVGARPHADRRALLECFQEKACPREGGDCRLLLLGL